MCIPRPTTLEIKSQKKEKKKKKLLNHIFLVTKNIKCATRNDVCCYHVHLRSKKNKPNVRKKEYLEEKRASRKWKIQSKQSPNCPNVFQHFMITLIITRFFVPNGSCRYIDSQISIFPKTGIASSNYSISLAFWEESC